MKLDVVYTWVDPTNIEWVLERNKYIQSTYDSSIYYSRYESFDEIKYSLRSLFKYCDFFDRVFIVSNNGSKPKWLKSGGKVIVVDDRSIFPENKMTPNYNSNAIESCLHRIPGLSRYFVYMNDDFFITNNLSIDNIIDPSTKRGSVFMETDPIVSIYNKYLSSFLPEILYLGGGAAKARRYTYKRIGLARVNNIPIGHCFRIYDKNLIREFEELFFREINHTRYQRFRTTKSFCFCDGYAFYFNKLQKVIMKHNYKTKLILFTDFAIVNYLQMAHALNRLTQYQFLAIIDVRTKSNIENIQRIQHFLQRLFPDKSDFEL